MNKRGFLQFLAHPLTWVVIAFIFGFVFAILIARNIIPIKLPICP